jgi:hypothetical protein
MPRGGRRDGAGRSKGPINLRTRALFEFVSASNGGTGGPRKKFARTDEGLNGAPVRRSENRRTDYWDSRHFVSEQALNYRPRSLSTPAASALASACSFSSRKRTLLVHLSFKVLDSAGRVRPA